MLDDIRHAGGFSTPRDLRRRLGCTERTLHRRLAELVAEGQLVRHGHGQYALTSTESLALSDTAREVVHALAGAGLEAHLTAFDVLAPFAHQFVYAFPHVIYAEPYATGQAARILADAGFVVIPAGKRSGDVELPDLSRKVVLRAQSEAARRYGVIGHLAPPEKAWVDLLRETRRSDLPIDLGEVGRILRALREHGCDEPRLQRYAERMRYDTWLQEIERATPTVTGNPELSALRNGYRAQ